MKHSLFLADDLRDARGFGHWAIGIRDEDGHRSGYHLGELHYDPGLREAADAARPLAVEGSGGAGGAFTFQTKKRARQALRLAKTALNKAQGI